MIGSRRGKGLLVIPDNWEGGREGEGERDRPKKREEKEREKEREGEEVIEAIFLDAVMTHSPSCR